MEDIFKAFVKQYTDEIEAGAHKYQKLRRLRNPVIFVFIGDKAIEASKRIYIQVHKEWDNSEGVLFFNVCKAEKLISQNMFNYNIDYDCSQIINSRSAIKKAFYESDEKLIELNGIIIKMKNKLREYGKMFTSFKKVNIAVVTRADDPLNVLVKEITLLLKAKLYQIFNINTADLYTLLLEKNEEHDEFYNGALSVSFFKEIEYFQSRKFSFNEKIEAFDEKRKLPVKWNKPLFELVYVLSDTNLNGIIRPKSLEENYNIICYINLIKNREVSIETNFDIKNNIYNDVRFKRNISDEDEDINLASAGLAVIKKPYGAAAMTVLSCMFNDLVEVMKKTEYGDVPEVLKKLNIDENGLNGKIDEIMPKQKTVDDMYAIKTTGQCDLKGLSLSEAERVLYGEACESFFAANFSVPLETAVKRINVDKTLEQSLDKIMYQQGKGLYYCLFWTGEKGIIKAIKDLEGQYDNRIKKLQFQVEEVYGNRLMDSFSLKYLLNRNSYINIIKQQLFKEVYERKKVIQELKNKKKLLESYAAALKKYNQVYSEKAEKINALKEELKEYTIKLINEQDYGMSQNIGEYYTSLARKKISELKEKYGDKFYFSGDFLGNPAKLMENGLGTLVQKLQQICLKYVLLEDEFQMTFEEDLNERKKINGFTKGNIYKKLCTLLDENAVPKSLIYDYNVKTYEEKYFFGDYSSDFIKYAYSFDREWGNYSTGYIHEKKAVGIEKLSLFGGFKLKDLVYYKNSLKYYEALQQETK